MAYMQRTCMPKNCCTMLTKQLLELGVCGMQVAAAQLACCRPAVVASASIPSDCDVFSNQIVPAFCKHACSHNLKLQVRTCPMPQTLKTLK